MATFAPTEYYIRPASGTDTAGQGTSHATAYQSLAFALNDITTSHGGWPASGAIRFNMNDEADHLVTAQLPSITTGSNDDGHWLQGYTSTAGDGGVAKIVDSAASADQLFENPHYDKFNFVDLDVESDSLGIKSFTSTTDRTVMLNCKWNCSNAGNTAVVNVCDCYVIGCDIRKPNGTINQGMAIGTFLELTFCMGNIFESQHNWGVDQGNSMQSFCYMYNIFKGYVAGYHYNSSVGTGFFLNNAYVQQYGNVSAIGKYLTCEATSVNEVYVGYDLAGHKPQDDRARWTYTWHSRFYDCDNTPSKTNYSQPYVRHYDNTLLTGLSPYQDWVNENFNMKPDRDIGLAGTAFPPHLNLDHGPIQGGSGEGPGTQYKHPAQGGL